MTSPPIHTRLTRLLGIASPIISAPMTFGASPALAAAVSLAGGFGFIGAGPDSSTTLISHLQSIRTTLTIPSDFPVPIGIGFIGFLLESSASEDKRISAVLTEKPGALWFAFGDGLGRYVAQVRDYDKEREHKTVVFVMVGSVEQAGEAVKWGVDVIVAQGNEAGGHGTSKSPPTSILVQAIINAFPPSSNPKGPLIVAAGGITTGAQVASYLTLGADGVVMGTRFLFTDECVFSPEMKEILVKADLNATKRSFAFDEMIRMKWPDGIDGRAIGKGIVEDAEQGVPLEERLKRYNEGKASGDEERLIVWAGAGSGLTSEIKPASDVFHEVHADTYKALKVAASLVQ